MFFSSAVRKRLFCSNSSLLCVRNNSVSDSLAQGKSEGLSKILNNTRDYNTRQLMSALVVLRINESLSLDSSLLLTSLEAVDATSGTQGGELAVTGANIVARRLKRGLARDNQCESKIICSLLELSEPSWPQMHSVFIARALRAVSLTAGTFWRDSILSKLIAEASRRERVSNYSVMDISEILHSISTISEWADPAVSQPVSDFFQELVIELLERQSYMKVALSVTGKKTPQSITIQGLSNVAFAIDKMNKLFPQLSLDSVTSLIRNLIANHTEPDAFQACQPVHLVTLLRSITVEFISSDELKGAKKLVNEMKRKKVLGHFDSDVMDETLSFLRERYVGNSKGMRFINSLS